MLELADRLLGLLRTGAPVAVATSVDVIGSAPHLAGTSMAVTASGVVVGSVSAGCVESSALRACQGLLRGGGPQQLRFGFGEAEAARAGLSCGGELDVVVHLVAGAALQRELEAAAAGRAAAVGIVVAGPPAALGAVVAGGEGAGLGGELVDGAVDGPADGLSVERLRAAVAAQAATGRSGPVVVDGAGTGPGDAVEQPVRLFVDVAAPAPRMVVVGATETAAALVVAAAAVGYVVTVCDHRAELARADRFPGAAGVVVALPHELLAVTPLDGRSAVCVLSHDDDLDPLAVAVALERGAGYVGALGSRSTTARRRERLRVLGLSDALAERLHAPIGLDLGASTPAETAVSVLAEVLAVRSGALGSRLTSLSGPIHRPSHTAGRPATSDVAGASARSSRSGAPAAAGGSPPVRSARSTL